ncbi:MAG: substrate-binding domain-containing protein [Vicinamibacteria bacterium]
MMLVGVAVTSQGQQAPPLSTVRLSGSTTVLTNVFVGQQERIARQAGIEISVIGNGSRQGLSDLISGRADIAMISAPLEEVEAQMTPAERAHITAAGLSVSAIGNTKLLFIVNPANSIEALTIRQLSDLFSGVVTNWKQVGGPDLAVELVSNKFSSGQRAVLEDKVLGGKDVASTAKLVVNDPLIPGIVRQLKGGLGHTGERNDLKGVKMVRTDKVITQPMALVTLGKPSGPIAKIIAATQDAFLHH